VHAQRDAGLAAEWQQRADFGGREARGGGGQGGVQEGEECSGDIVRHAGGDRGGIGAAGGERIGDGGKRGGAQGGLERVVFGAGFVEPGLAAFLAGGFNILRGVAGGDDDRRFLGGAGASSKSST
jgi:hypothetical protein